ncbi:MAG: thiamine-phosphate kinase [Gammaproteobacteria bacterium]
MSEQDIIQKYFSRHQKACETVDVSVGDDAAIVIPPKESKLVLTTDTLNEGVHFYPDCEPKFIGHKSLAVSLSDVASMGATPLWATLNLSLPKINHKWLKEFSDSLYSLADNCGLKIVGGDLVKGPLSITVQVIGGLSNNEILLRSACQVDDLVYVTGALGDAALGLTLAKNNLNQTMSNDCRNYFLTRLHMPTPRLDVARHIVDYAHAAIDISDGFLIDLQRMLNMSNKAAEIELTHIPISDAMQQKVKNVEDIKNLLTGGEDYELIFTINAQDKNRLERFAKTENIIVTEVGIIANGSGISLTHQGIPTELPKISGFDHFQ